MGFFGTYYFSGGAWTHAPKVLAEHGPPWLLVDIHDSDFTVLRYGPSSPGTGTAYLGYTPRSYFEDVRSSEPTDVELEAEGLARWSALTPSANGTVRVSDIRPFLAADHDNSAEEDDEDELEDEPEQDEGEIFVEVKTARFLRLLGLPLPDDLLTFADG